MRGLSVVLVVLAAVLFVSPQLWAKTFYLKNGDEIEYQSYRQKDGAISVLINRDTEVDFPLDEVDLEKTAKAAAEEEKKAAAAAKKAKKKKGVKRPAVHRGAKPKPGKAAPAKAGEKKPAPAASPAPAAKPVPAPAKAGPAASQAVPAALKTELAAVYDKFHRATRAGDFDGQMKYVAAKNQAQMKEMMAKAPGNAKEMVAGLMQAMTAKSYTVTGCTPSSDGRSATLALKGKIDFMGKDADSDGTVSFVREGNEWKIDKVAWSAKG